LPTVQGLALVHLSVTALLLVVLALVVVCQRLVRAIERTPPSPYPSDDGVAPLAVPAPAPPGDATPTRASVLDWTIDLREPHSAGARLQTS
jgi:hypothetical protein